MIGFLLFGLFVGFAGRALSSGRSGLGLLATLGLGVAGSVIGGLVANLLGTGGLFELNVLGAIVSFISAAMLVGVAQRLSA